MTKSVVKFESIYFYTTEGAFVPFSEKIGDLSLLPVIMQINKTHTYALNFQNDYSIEAWDEFGDTDNPEHIYEFSKAIGLKN